MKTPETLPSDATPPFVLRHDLKPGDLGTLVFLHGTVYAEEYGLNVAFEAYVAATLADLVHSQTERDRLWIGECGGRIVGSVAIVGKSESEAQLRWFFVDPSARGVGLGRQLLRQALEFTEQMGYASVFLWTVDLLQAAAHLYCSAGFEKVEEKTGIPWGVPVIEQKYVLRMGSRPSLGGPFLRP
jgi:GNAT superfamily N-acetyltransferase